MSQTIRNSYELVEGKFPLYGQLHNSWTGDNYTYGPTKPNISSRNMLSKNVMKQVAIRVRIMALFGQTIYTWDSSKGQLVPASVYKRWNWWLTNLGGIMFVLCHCLQVHMSLTDGNEQVFNVRKFATLVVECGEIIVAAVVCVLGILILQRRDEIIYTYNQLFIYNKTILDMMKIRNIMMDAQQRKTVRTAEFLTFLFSFLTAAFPFALLAVIFHPLEPNHVIFREWFEFELIPSNITWAHICLVPIFLAAAYCAGNDIYVFGFLALCYIFTTVPCLTAITPVGIRRRSYYAGRYWKYNLATRHFGVLEDNEIIKLYRIQQYLNILINNVVKSFLLSLHHVGCLATVCVLAYFGIKFQAVLYHAGVLGYVVVFGGLCSPLMMEFYEAVAFGKLVDISQEFKETGMKLMGRKSYFGKFSRSCQKLYVDEAYPFFKIRKDTFFQFLQQCVDYTITLLLW